MKQRFAIAGLLVGFVLLMIPASFFLVDVDQDGTSYFQGDCRPFDKMVGNNLSEISFDGSDQDCDGRDFVSQDEDDKDADGFSVLSGDCNDQNASIHPNAIELADDVDNDCDHITDEKMIEIDLINYPIVPGTGSKTGYTGVEFLRDIGANSVIVTGSGTIYEGKLFLEATTKSALPPNADSKWTAIRLYIGRGTKLSFTPLEERYLDATWKGNGRSNLATPDDASEQGGVYYAGQLRTLEFNLRSVSVASRSIASDKSEELDVLSILNTFGKRGLLIGFSTSTPGFGQLNAAKLTFEVDESINVTASRIR
jgi:hypothetical protein